MTVTRLAEAASLLLAARRTGIPLAALPPAVRPTTPAEGYAVQALVTRALGPVGGWKVGAGSPAAEPGASALPAAGIHDSPAVLRGPGRVRGIEAEIAFRFSADLPPRDRPYAADEVLAAIASCHAAIEVVEPRFVSLADVDLPSQLADSQGHGALVLAAAVDAWNPQMFATLPVELAIDGRPARSDVGSNAAGDLIRLLVWLANTGAAKAGGIRAGQVVTTGSWTGMIPAPEGAPSEARFRGFPPVTLAWA